MDKDLEHGVRKLFADELYCLVRDNYNKVNHDYLQKQIDICSEYLSEEQKEEIRKKNSGFRI